MCDIEAQYTAVCDPHHPKQAMWIADSNMQLSPKLHAAARRCTERWGKQDLHVLVMPEGAIISRHYEDISTLSNSRHDRTLAEILGYLEPKWAVGLRAVVVRALDDEGCVITEMAVSPNRAGEAYEIVKQHGIPELTTIAAAHERRRIICASEAA